MALLVPFKLGRPNREALFEINPAAMSWNDTKVADSGRAIDGSLAVSTLSRSRPTVRLNGNYVSPDMWNQLRALSMVDDTFLVFEAFDDVTPNTWESWTERVIPASLTSIVLSDNSALRGSALRKAAGGASCVSLVGLWDDIPSTAGRIGTGFNRLLTLSFFADYETPTYVAGNIGGQDGWTYGLGTVAFQVSTTSPIVGLQSVRVTAGAGVSSTIERVIPSQVVPYDVEWYMSQDGSFSTAFLEAANAAYPAGQTWSVGMEGTTLIYANSSLSYSVASGTYPAGTPVLLRVNVTGTTLTLYANNVAVGTVAVAAPTISRLRKRVFALAGALPTARWDNVAVRSSIVTATYDDPTRSIALVTALPDLSPRFLTYTCPCMAVHLKEVPSRVEGGWINLWKYDLELEGA